MVSQEKSKSFAIIWYQGKQKKDRPSIGFNFKKRSDLEIHVLGFVICTYCGPLYVAGFVLFNVIGINRLAKMNIWELGFVICTQYRPFIRYWVCCDECNGHQSSEKRIFEN